MKPACRSFTIVGNERAEVAVVHPEHVNLQSGIVEFAFAVKFQQHFEAKLMGGVYQSAAFSLAEN